MGECLYIVVPAYNEVENIPRLIENWYPIVEKYSDSDKSRLVIIDDGSKDNTYNLICEYAKTRPMIVPITKTNGGHGATVLFGYRYAIQNGADYIFQTDADGQTDPLEFEQFWDLRNEYSAIIGNRSTRQDGFSRKFVEGTLLAILKIIFGVKIPDSNAPFRLMRKELLEKYIKKMPDDFNLPNVMFTTYFSYFHEKIKFLDITFKSRQGGKNSINFRKITQIGWKALRDFYNLKKNIDVWEQERR